MPKSKSFLPMSFTSAYICSTWASPPSQRSKATVEEAVNAVAWVQQLAAHQPISSSPFIQATLAGLQRKLAKPWSRKKPITVEMLSRIVGSMGASSALSDVRLAASCLLVFAAFPRYDDLV